MNPAYRVLAATALLVAGPAFAATQDAPAVSRGADYVSKPVTPERFFLDARTRPVLPAWKPGDPVREIPRQFHGKEEQQRHPPEPANPVVQNIDVLVQLQRTFDAGNRAPRGGGFTTPLFNADGQGYNGVVPPDPTGDVGGGYYVEVINSGGGASYTIYDTTTGALAAGPFNMDDLGSGGACASGFGDGVVLYDHLAERWLFTEFTSGSNDLCVYVSAGSSPVATTWTRYVFTPPSFPDYPKYGVWSDAYYVGANEGPAVYAMDRTRMLAGQTATMQRKSVADLGGLGFQMTPPASVFGTTPPPAGAPGFFIRMNDDERNNAGSNDPANDFIEMFTLSVDFATPANTVLTGPIRVAESEFDSRFQVSGFGAIHQPGTTRKLDPLLEVPMVPVHYRNFGSYEVLVGNHVVRLPDDTTNNVAGIRWFELRRTGGPANPWVVHQEGTYAPDDADGQISRWMAAIGMDESGNIAMGYSVARDPGVFPGLRYVGREASDPLGVMTSTETTLVDGASVQTGADRWGDYFGLGVDPADGCTFWFTGMYMPPGGNWRTRYAAFRFDTCGTPTFTTTADNLSQDVCAASATPTALTPITIQVNARNGFSDPVAMSFASGLPTGFSGSYSVTPVTPPGSTVATLAVNDTATPGSSTITLRASSGGTDRDLQLTVNLATQSAGAATLSAPADGADSVPSQPQFSWQAVDQASSYTVEIADDAGFTNVILAQTVSATTFRPSAALPLNTPLWWRVTANNECGSTTSAAFSFTTQAGPGQCSLNTPTQTLFSDDVESGEGGWTHEAAVGSDGWSIATSRPASPSHSWKGLTPGTVSDSRLLSPAIDLPADLSGLNLQFQHWRLIEGTASECKDGGILEVSLDGGAFSQVPAAQLLTDPYTAPIASGSGNPLAGNPAWCGSKSYTNVIVDLSSYAGHSARFRYRLTTDSSGTREGWYVDDVKVIGCGELEPTDRIFADGFDGSVP
ncbi:hypothetical protein [Dokdonella sp.]|uniref:hypothetical protein n=1 Tax=Dokdonella sp. TaxID=2291710 RepID=UPI001B1427FD|nr:hypothetical protein [Dokdonella sp.]MBO9663863.1 hypothetical protein [Dokdonella sp.]